MKEPSRPRPHPPVPPFRCDRLTILAGPPCVGKSHLIGRARSLSNGRTRELLGVHGNEDFVEVHAAELHRLEGENPDHLILHYDVLRQRRDSGFQGLNGVIPRAAEVRIVTLWEGTSVLRRRVRVRLRDWLARTLRGGGWLADLPHHVPKAWRQSRFYRDAAAVESLCADWLKYASTVGVEGVPHSLWTSAMGEPRLLSPGTPPEDMARALVRSPA